MFWRAAVVQLVAVAALAAVLGMALPHGFFEDWGWLVGPGAWVACAALTAMMVRLPAAPHPGRRPARRDPQRPRGGRRSCTGSAPRSRWSSSRSGARGCRVRTPPSAADAQGAA